MQCHAEVVSLPFRHCFLLPGYRKVEVLEEEAAAAEEGNEEMEEKEEAAKGWVGYLQQHPRDPVMTEHQRSIPFLDRGPPNKLRRKILSNYFNTNQPQTMA